MRASVEILKRLISFNTVSSESNLALIEYARALLASRGIECRLVLDDTGKKANLFASVGPAHVPGVLLSGHTDVVPVEGQAWTMQPFAATEQDGRIYGRGSCDMKGFIACALQAMLTASTLKLQRPLQLALSYDEEIGCVGVRRLIDVLELAPVRPYVCLIGEPTSMQIGLGHKGKSALRLHCRGQAGHSSLAPLMTNAIHLATDFIGALRTTQAHYASRGHHDHAYDIPYSTLHVGRIQGGKALNIVPDSCSVDFEIRHLAQDDPIAMIESLAAEAERLATAARSVSPDAAVRIETLNSYPGLETHPSEQAVAIVRAMADAGNGVTDTKVAFGTEGGLFANRLGVPVVICGPGSIDQAHKPDEFVSCEQLERCDDMLGRLVNSLAM
jgi:acetylornithine deacetylase